MKEITISNRDGVLTVSSLRVAADFQKDHRHVTEVIRNLTAENPAVKNLFIESSYINERGREYKCYELTRDGFSLLVMGFTGKKALEWKLKYIEAFNKMEQQLRSNSLNLEEIISRTVTVAVSETVKALIPLMQQNRSVSMCDPNMIDTQLRRSRGIISQLDPALRIEVDDMLLSRKPRYVDIQAFLAEHGVTISVAAIGEYKKRLFRKEW